MASTGGLPPETDMPTPYAPRFLAGAWMIAGWAGAAYGIFLTMTVVRSPVGAEPAGQAPLAPAFKASMAALLAVAAAAHPVVRERRWLMPALGFSALGDWMLAIPGWPIAFVYGLGSFLLAHLCYLGALVPLVALSRARAVGVAMTGIACAVLLAWFWPGLVRDGLVVPVVVYIVVLGALVCAALLARLPTVWTAAGAVLFAVSDAMIGVDRFSPASGWYPDLGGEALAVPIWWAYAGAQLLITTGFFFGRAGPPTSGSSATPAG
jgi:uncharacterized membrane protein YhhN